MNAADIDALLPQTQCTRCGFAGCRPYAEAIVEAEAEINQCPPGGAHTIARLAAALGREVLPLNPANGIEGPPLVAQIDEGRCIGCVKCLAPCPVDAIVGAKQLLHTVITQLCTGCELCVAPCPVDCIVMVPRNTLTHAGDAPDPAHNLERFTAHSARLTRLATEQAAILAAAKHAARAP
jgi:electron transport complex protein RnfB